MYTEKAKVYKTICRQHRPYEPCQDLVCIRANLLLLEMTDEEWLRGGPTDDLEQIPSLQANAPILAEMSNSFPIGNEFPQVATRIAYGYLATCPNPFPICMPKTCVSPCLPRIMHIMHGLNLHMHAQEGERITFTTDAPRGPRAIWGKAIGFDRKMKFHER